MKYAIVAGFSGFLLIGHFFNYGLIMHGPWDIPEYVPGTPISIPGALSVALLLTILILAQKQILKKDSGVSVPGLTLQGAIICFLAELPFQAFRWSVFEGYSLSERLQHLAVDVVVMTLMATIFSFFVAFQLKTKRTWQMIGMIVVLAFLANLVKGYLTHLR